MKFGHDRSLYFLTAASFFAGLSIGYVKFYLLGYISEKEHSLADKAWIIQSVGALITLGPCLTFVVGGPLASAYRKCSIMFISAITISGIMAFGAASQWAGSGWIYLFMAGLGLGLYNAARNSAVPIEASRDNVSTEFVNACANNLYIVGLLFGVPIGTEMYVLLPELGAWICSLLFLCSALLGLGSKISGEQSHLKSFRLSFTQLASECKLLLSRFHLFLFASPMLWGIAGALSLAATAYVEECNFAGPLLASLMSVYAAVGVITGNFVSTKVTTQRYSAAFNCSLGLGISVAAIPAIGFFSESINIIGHLGYISLSAILMLCGFFFGCASNLIEAEYLTQIYQEKREGTGAALLSAMTSLWAFILGGLAAIAVISGVLTSSTQFIALSSLTCLVCALIVKLKHKDTD